MIKFIYDNKYKHNYILEKLEIEKLIQKFILENFESYIDLDIKINMLSNKHFKDSAASAIASKNIIKFNFDKCKDYLSHLKTINNKVDMPKILNEKQYLSHILYHEMQHIINYIECKDVFNYIKSIDNFAHIKLGIECILDEYIASYYAQKKFVLKTGSLEELIRLCKQKEDIIKSNDQSLKLLFYIKIIHILPYSIAESDALSENSNVSDKFNDILKNDSVISFEDIFSNIRKLIQNYSLELYKIYVKGCEVELFKLIMQLNINSNYLKNF
jgi:hypothetical protein